MENCTGKHVSEENEFEFEQRAAWLSHSTFDMETIYQRPHDYDLEHEGDDEDVAFYVRLLEKWQPRRVFNPSRSVGDSIRPPHLSRTQSSAGNVRRANTTFAQPAISSMWK